MTDCAERSPYETMLAIFRWTKTSPGRQPRIVVSGTRESEQPIQRMAGDWPLERGGIREGSDSWVLVAQARLAAM